MTEIPAPVWVQYGLIMLFLAMTAGIAKWLTWLLEQQRGERTERDKALERFLDRQRAEREERDVAWRDWLAAQGSGYRHAMESQAQAHREHIERFVKEHRDVMHQEMQIVVEALRAHQHYLEQHRADSLRHIELFREEVGLYRRQQTPAPNPPTKAPAKRGRQQ